MKKLLFILTSLIAMGNGNAQTYHDIYAFEDLHIVLGNVKEYQLEYHDNVRKSDDFALALLTVLFFDTGNETYKFDKNGRLSNAGELGITEIKRNSNNYIISYKKDNVVYTMKYESRLINGMYFYRLKTKSWNDSGQNEYRFIYKDNISDNCYERHKYFNGELVYKTRLANQRDIDDLSVRYVYYYPAEEEELTSDNYDYYIKLKSEIWPVYNDKETSSSSATSKTAMSSSTSSSTANSSDSSTGWSSRHSSTTSSATISNSEDKQIFTVNGVSFTMVRVEGGTFMMGATEEQGSDAEDNEKPAHQVTLSTYSIGETEVTQELWQAVMGSNPSKYKGNKRPVERVRWYDCQDFIRKLNAATGKTFRLPTEAEWEYAARGGNRSRGYKYAGSNDIESVAWYRENSYNKGESIPDYIPHEVGTKLSNELGLYDMSGNVSEWCQDWNGSYSSRSQTNPKGPESGEHRQTRGGNHVSHTGDCRVSNREAIWPSIHNYNLGLRLVLSE